MIGRELRLDGQPLTVVGVMPKDFQLLGGRACGRCGRSSTCRRAPAAHPLQVVGRLKPSVAGRRERGRFRRSAEGLAREFPETNKGRGVRLEPLHDAMIGSELAATSMLFLGVVGFVLLICCANVANLLLARATVRTRELAVRSALGAGRGRIVRQLLTESLVLSLIGGALGNAVGAAILTVAPSLIPEGLLPAAVTLTFDVRVVAFCAAAALLVGLLFGLRPRGKPRSSRRLRQSASNSRSVTGRGGRLRGLLVRGEVATAVLLLFGAGLLLRTLMAVDDVDAAIAPKRPVDVVDPLGSRYPSRVAAAVLRPGRAGDPPLPGCGRVAWSSELPLGDSSDAAATSRFYGSSAIPRWKRAERPSTESQVVSPTYFSTVDLPIIAGRAFDDRDNRGSRPPYRQRGVRPAPPSRTVAHRREIRPGIR